MPFVATSEVFRSPRRRSPTRKNHVRQRMRLFSGHQPRSKTRQDEL